MSHPWLLLAFSWIGPASLQYIDTGAISADAPLDLVDSNLQYPLPYTHFFNQPPNFDFFQNDMAINYQLADEPTRKRRMTNEPDYNTKSNVDTDKTVYFKNEVPTPDLMDYHDDNQTDIDKRNFSPWGGKRDGPQALEHMWSWKRSAGIREPSMPKRVRFSPWGGKRSGQMIYKPGVKASKIIFFSSIPELKSIVSKYSPSWTGRQIRSFEFIPGMDKRHPIKILAVSRSSVDMDRSARDALPFNSLMDSAPKVFKPGHPYSEVHLKKDGKRKMKFSIWGGKRSPPIIGPIWTPATEDSQTNTLHTILLLRSKPNQPNAL